MQSGVESHPLPVVGRLASERRLAAAAARGNEAALAELYRRFHQPLYRYLRGFLGSAEEAEDALHNAFLKAFGALRKGAAVGALRPWLFRIAHNEAVALLRARGPLAAADAPEQLGQQRAQFAQLLEDLAALGQRQRAALLLHELSGLPVAEVGAALGCSSGAAKQLLFEARTALHDFAEGRRMECEAVQLRISERDGRLLRSRQIAAHLRSCASCRRFREEIEERRLAFNALFPPLAPGIAAALLARVVGGAKGSGSGGAAAGSSALAHPLAGLAAKGAVVALLVGGGSGAGLLAANGAKPSHPAQRRGSPTARAGSSGSAGAPVARLRRAQRPTAPGRGPLGRAAAAKRSGEGSSPARSSPAQQRGTGGAGLKQSGGAERGLSLMPTGLRPPEEAQPKEERARGGGPEHPIGLQRAAQEREAHLPDRGGRPEEPPGLRHARPGEPAEGRREVAPGQEGGGRTGSAPEAGRGTPGDALREERP